MSVSHVADCPDLGPDCFDGDHQPTPYNHHIDQLMAEMVLQASLGITPWFAVDTRWSLRIADVNPTYSELDGTPKEVPDDIHHHDETLVDVTDPWLLGRLAATQGDFIGILRAGLSFPLGRIEPDPYALGRKGQSHQHLQAGTGTFVPIVGFGVGYTLAKTTPTPVTIGLGGIGLFNAYENSEGFRAPIRLYASHRVAVSFMKGVLTPFFEATLAHEGEELWHGEVGLEGSNIRSEVYLGGGIEWRFYEAWAVDLTTRARIATLTEAPSFESYGLFSIGISTTFDLWDTKEELAAMPVKPEGDEGESGPRIREEEKGGVIEFEKE